ncbi:PCNA-associated factor-like [Ptychodera flava]|uniref:PCNA-associated factor-like n=1 Tax=Ptychodera flava TaxID=63121 RepID=UPI00396A0317
MVRTKADGCGRKAVAAKAPRKVLSSPSAASFTSPGKSGGKNKYAGGNSVCPRPTPSWQKGINQFCIVSPSGKRKTEKENEEPNEAGCSSDSGKEGTSSCEGSSSMSTDTTTTHKQEDNATDSEDDD